jgi:predicted nucleic acid-binding protein
LESRSCTQNVHVARLRLALHPGYSLVGLFQRPVTKTKAPAGAFVFGGERLVTASQPSATILRMKLRVYVESSVISYLAARPSRDLVVAAHQQVTREWWDQSKAFDLCISNFVIAEISSGDESQARSRIEYIVDALVLESSHAVEALADLLIAKKAVPAKARLDALHISVCAVHGIDYLLTWNCKHIANAKTMSLIENICTEAGYQCPRLCTPLELMES